MSELTKNFSLPSMRVSYELSSLSEDDLADSWHEQLSQWLNEAAQFGLPEPNAMVLATADARGHASSRTVLAKGLDERGLVFYTNFTSAKSHDLMANWYASATFPWFAMQRQAHIRGPVEKVSPEELEAYWASRPRRSQIGAWASPQSRVVQGRSVLDAALNKIERQFSDAEVIPVPPHWGGWRIKPEEVEFWQGRRDRMHDRLRFKLHRSGWTVQRVGP